MTLFRWTAVAAGVAVIAVLAQGAIAKPAKPPSPNKPAATAAQPGVRAVDLYQFNVQTIDGTQRSLADFKGKTLLIVNTASECGNTRQYKSLETLYEKYAPKGFTVLAFPANNFGGQEPGSNAEIKTFCSTRYKTTFPLFAKISVKGKDIAPLYHYLTTESGFPGDVGWNFAKFLVNPDGKVVARFEPSLDPLKPEVTKKIESTLAAAAEQHPAR